MQLGTYEPKLLEKGRVALPKKIRDEITGTTVVLTIGFETCVFGFDEKTWEAVILPELSKPFFSDVQARKMRRKMCVNAMKVQIDSQGRIIVPDYMRAFAHILDTIVAIGAGDHFEIWDKALWQKYEKDL